MTLSGTSTYTGATVINEGSLDLSTGSIAGGVNINGTGATLVYNGSTFTPTVTATNGTILGTGTINTVVVPVGGKLITTGNGVGGTLNVNSLTFSGAGTIDVPPCTNYCGYHDQ